MPVEGEAPACDVLATVWTVSGIGDEPDNRESTETLLRKLYAKAKAELSPQGPFARITAVLDRALSSAGGRTGRHAACLRVKSFGEPDAGNPHVRFDERGEETGRLVHASSHRASPRLYQIACRIVEITHRSCAI